MYDILLFFSFHRFIESVGVSVGVSKKKRGGRLNLLLLHHIHSSTLILSHGLKTKKNPEISAFCQSSLHNLPLILCKKKGKPDGF